MTQPIDRSQWTTRLCRSFAEADAEDAAQYAAMTPAQRLEMVEILSREAWALSGVVVDGREFPRHVERLIRGER